MGPSRGLTRLSGGASRITSSFDLVADDGAVRPLILQQERGPGLTPGGRTGVEAALLRPPRPSAGVPVPGGGGGGHVRRARPRLAGRRATRGRDHPPPPAPRRRLGHGPGRADRPVRRRTGRHPPDPGRRRPRPAAAGPVPRPAPVPRRPGRGPAGARARRAVARPPPARARTAPSPCTATSAWATCWSAPTDCAPSSTGSSPTPATRRRTSAGCAAPAWRFGGAGDGRGRRRPGRAARRLRGGRRRSVDPRPDAVVAGLRHRQVGGDLRPAGLGPPRGREPLGRAGGDRPTGLRERVGPRRAARAGTGRTVPAVDAAAPWTHPG